jgi:hypothetical protein
MQRPTPIQFDGERLTLNSNSSMFSIEITLYFYCCHHKELLSP